MNKMRYIKTTAVLLCSLFFAGCISENIDQSGVGEVTFSFSLSVPGNPDAMTYSLGSDAEAEIKTIDVLVFRENGTGEYFLKHFAVEKFTIEGSITTFTATVEKNSDLRFVVIANAAGSVVGNAKQQGQGQGWDGTTLKADLLKQLMFTNTDGFEQAVGGTPANFPGFPMWGESSLITIIDDFSTKWQTIKVSMLRAVAVIDITVAESLINPGDNQAAFTLTEAYLYNYNTNGLVAPYSGNWDGSEKVTAVSLPADPGTVNYETDDKLKWTPIANEFKNTIYAPEAEAAKSNDLLKATALVVGGKYNGSEEITYYRIDIEDALTKDADLTVYLPLLRNHRYTISIADVSGPGLKDPDEAFKNVQFNNMITVIKWGDVSIEAEIGQWEYYLNVGQSLFEIDAKKKTYETWVKTDCDEGWKITGLVYDDANVPFASGWLSLTGTYTKNGPPNVEAKLQYNVTANGDNKPRECYIKIEARNLAKYIVVKQAGTNN